MSSIINYVKQLNGAYSDLGFESVQQLILHFPGNLYKSNHDHLDLYSALEIVIAKDTRSLLDMQLKLPDTYLRLNFDCNQILALFVIQMSRFITQAFYVDLIVFVNSFRMTLNKLGNHFVNKMFVIESRLKKPTNKEFCQGSDMRVAPEICNEFLAFGFEESLNTLKDQSK